MFAESVRMPLNGFASITGVFPVAMTTIIVSPMARPKPIMIAETMPEIAVGTTTRQTVCQRLAPQANEPETSDVGTLDKASSAIVNTSGMTAKPMTKPTTKELRESYDRPLVWRHHSRKSATFWPEARSLTVKQLASIHGAADQAAQPASTRKGISQTNSQPGPTRRRTGCGSRDHR